MSGSSRFESLWRLNARRFERQTAAVQLRSLAPNSNDTCKCILAGGFD